MAAALFIVLAIAVSANASANKLTIDSTQVIEKKLNSSLAINDSLFLPPPPLNHAIVYENLYQRRLDSIQGTVFLAYNEYVQNYIDIYTSRKEQIGKMLGLSKYYFPIFEKALKEAGIPEEIKFITVVESALNPNAVSKSGAVGPWQFMYTTAKGYGLVMDNYVDERKDPVKASYAAAHYLMEAYNTIGDWLLTIAAFNCGTGAVTRAIQRSGGVADFWQVRPFLPRETQNYVPAFIATVYAMKYYKDHDIDIRPADFNILTDVIPVNKTISISAIAKAADLDLNELLILNPSYKKHIVNGTVQSPKALVIPNTGNSIYASLYNILNGDEDEKEPAMIKAAMHTGSDSKSAGQAYHKVQPGQSLINIANQYSVEMQDLKVWNNMNTTTIVPGQNIRISSPGVSVAARQQNIYFNYIVKVGDTLSGIAEKFKGVTVSKLKALNGLSRSGIKPGMNLRINRG